MKTFDHVSGRYHDLSVLDLFTDRVEEWPTFHTKVQYLHKYLPLSLSLE